MSINIPRRLLADLIAHAVEEDPSECCGFLLGAGDEADEIHRMTNVNSKPIEKYTMDFEELVEAQDIATNSQRELVAIYHSHTYKRAIPSIADISNAVKVASISTRHVIISLLESTRPEVRAFRVDESSEVTELVIETDGERHRASD